MATRAGLNKNSSAVKRIMSEARELRDDDSTEYTAGPLEEDIFEWHCTIRGPSDTEFEGGLYHCRISLPPEYPFKAPSIMILTPNGRFELNKKVSMFSATYDVYFTSYHEELWQPAWGVRTAIIGLQGFFPLKGEAAVGVGAIEYPIAERKRLAALSRSWVCPDCGVPNIELLPDPPAKDTQSTEQPTTSSTEPAATPNVPESPSDATAGPEPTADNESLSVAPTLSQDSSPSSPELLSDTSSPPPPAPTTAPTPSTTAQPQNIPTPVLVDTAHAARNRPPFWLDASIAFFSIVIAYMMGKRLLWDFASDDFGPA
ncbi:hypothetical protein FRC04_001046 [Tulasnella sp. 424]|nr:hypothetical protein FRC04_001046 [Tulasnella sp. 424]KAG8977954.1 hypothetical protein FRC05_000482 [Tulasnella sp. 425]